MDKLDPYSYEFDGGANNLYSFSTIDGIVYEIKFIPSTEYFNAYPDLESDAFEMTISIADNPIGNRLPSDKRTAPTIFAIFEDFFLPKTQIIVFICDSSDGRAKARHRKFGLWFYNNVIQTDLLIKLDRGIADGDRSIYLSLIFSRLNPRASRIMDMFVYLGVEDK